MGACCFLSVRDCSVTQSGDEMHVGLAVSATYWTTTCVPTCAPVSAGLGLAKLGLPALGLAAKLLPVAAPCRPAALIPALTAILTATLATGGTESRRAACTAAFPVGRGAARSGLCRSAVLSCRDGFRLQRCTIGSFSSNGRPG